MVHPTRLSPVSRSQSTTTVEDLHTTRVVLLTPAHPRTRPQPPTHNNIPGAYNRCQSPGAPTIRTRRFSIRAAGLTLNRPISRLNLGCRSPSQWFPARTSYNNNPASTPPPLRVVRVTTSIDLEAGTVGVVTDRTVTQSTSIITDRSFIPVLNDGASGYWCFLLMFWKPVFVVAILNNTLPCWFTHPSLCRAMSLRKVIFYGLFSQSPNCFGTYILYFYSYMLPHF